MKSRSHGNWLRTLLVVSLLTTGGAASAQEPARRPSNAVASTALSLQGELPADPASAAVRIDDLQFPSGVSRVRIYVVAPGLDAGSTSSSGFIGTVSPAMQGATANGMALPASFTLSLEPKQVEAVASQKALLNDKEPVTVLLEPVGRAGRPYAGARPKAALATLTDRNQLVKPP